MQLHSLSIEMNVISCLMAERIDEYDYETVLSGLERLDFHDTAVRKVFEEVQKRFKNGKAFDRLAIESYFERTEEYNFDIESFDMEDLEDDEDEDEDEVSTGNDVLDLLSSLNSPDIQNFESHVAELKELSQRRKIKRLGYKLVEDSENDEIDGEELASSSQSELNEILDSTSNDDDLFDAEDTTLEALNHLAERAKIKDEIYGQRTGFEKLDKLLKGLQESTLVVIGGRPAMGKSAFAFNIASYIGLNGGHVLNYSLEMPKKELTLRIWSSMSGIEQDVMKSAKFNSSEEAKLAETVEQFRQSDIKISDKENLTIQQVKAAARKAHRVKPLSAIVLDYLQLMKLPKADTKANAVGEISRELKTLANELKIPVIVLSQLNRDLEKRVDKRPVSADLRDSGAIEQDADVIMFVYRDEVYNPDTEDKGIAEIIVAKHRGGELGTIKLKFEGQYARFANIVEEQIEEDSYIYHDAANHIYSDQEPIERMPL